jgi:hypothetical protein
LPIIPIPTLGKVGAATGALGIGGKSGIAAVDPDLLGATACGRELG